MSSTAASTEEVAERLRRLQWTTFDLNRQNELLRRMLEIQCTVNQNAQQVAATKVTLQEIFDFSWQKLIINPKTYTFYKQYLDDGNQISSLIRRMKNELIL